MTKGTFGLVAYGEEVGVWQDSQDYGVYYGDRERMRWRSSSRERVCHTRRPINAPPMGICGRIRVSESNIKSMN